MVNDLSGIFAALADPTRLRVVDLLRAQQLSAGDLADRCSMSPPAMSRHLRTLRHWGMVEVANTERSDDARLRVYRLRAEPFRSLSGWVEHMQAFWEDQLGGFKTYAERKPARKRKGRKGR